MDLFLDANAHVPLLDSALEAYVKFNSSGLAQGNAKSPSVIGKGSMMALEEARSEIAGQFN
jgi:cysteine sulfinate desulfinase/cysteine desulfurase-like protein